MVAHMYSETSNSLLQQFPAMEGSKERYVGRTGWLLKGEGEIQRQKRSYKNDLRDGKIYRVGLDQIRSIYFPS